MAGGTGVRDGRGERGWRIARWGGAAGLLLAPLAAMQVTDQVDWSAADFAIFGAMLVAACGVYEAAVRLTASRVHRAGLGLVIVATFLVVWLQLAVGIFH